MSGGLSTLNFMQGAMEGYRFMDERKDKQLNRERQLRQDEMVEADQKAKHGLYEVQADAARTRAEADSLKLQYARDDRPDELEQRKKENEFRETENDIKLQGLEKGNRALDAQKDRDVTAKEMAQLTMKELKTKQSQTQAVMLGRHFKAVKAGKKFAITPEGKHQAALANVITPDVLLGEEGAVATQVYEKLLSGEIDYKDPVVSPVLMTRFPAIQAVAKERGYNVLAAHLQPVPGEEGKFTIGLEIEGESELKPLTNGRSTDPNETVTVVTFEELADSFEKMITVQKLAQTEFGRAYFEALGDLMEGTPKFEDVNPEDAPAGQKNVQTGEYKSHTRSQAPGHNTQRDFVKHREVMMGDPHYKFLKRKYTESTTEDERTAINKEMEDYLLETFYGKVTPKPDGATQKTTDEPEATPSAFTSGAKNTGGRSNNAKKLKAQQTAPPDVNDFLDKEFKVP